MASLAVLESLGRELSVADVAAVQHEDDGVALRVVALPEAAQGVLAADVPDAEVAGGEEDCADVLADGGDGAAGGGGGVEDGC